MGFWDKMDQLISQGISSSKELLNKAKDKAQELGEKGLLKYEILQLEKQAEKLFAQLGVRVYEKLVSEGQATLSKGAVKELLLDIQDVKARIEKKEEDLRSLR